MKRTILPRTGALMLALAVVFGLLPMGALAATDYTQYSTEEFESQYTYAGEDLGAVWTKDATTFRVWAPTAAAVKVNLYEGGAAGENDLLEQLDMIPDVNGTWVVTKDGDLNGVYYTYQVSVDGKTNEACDPYARTTGVNGQRAMVIDLDSTDPEGWDTDVDPHYDGNLNDPAYQDVVDYYAGLIAFRKAHPALRMISAEEVAAHITPLPGLDFNVVGCHIASGANGEENELVAVFNPRKEASVVTLPEGQWTIYIDGENAGTTALGTAETEVSVEPISAMVLVKEPVAEQPAAEPEDEHTLMDELKDMIPVILGALTATVVSIYVMNKKTKKK